MKKKISKVINGFMVAATSVTTVGGVLATVPVQAAEPTNQTRNSGDYMVNNGVVDFGKGTANITIKGNAGQSLVGKRFEVFQLFNAENAKGGESINYTFKDEYATALKTVVASALNKRDGSSLKAADVTEYMVIDYIQTLNHDQVEGAQATQELEGRYSAFRYFVENVRTEIKNEGLSGDYVYVQGTTADNSVTLQGLQYGYYIVDEVSEHDEENSDYFASSLCMVDTANPTASINIKSDYPSIIKKIKEDDNQDTIRNEGWNDVADYEIGQTVQDPIVLSVKATMTDDRNNYVKGEGATDKTLQKLEATAHMKEFLNGAYKEDDTVLNTDVSKGSMDITVVNTVGTKLPITGSSAMLIMLGAGVVLVSGGVVMNKKKKNPAE